MTPALPPATTLEGLGRDALARFVVECGALLTAATVRLATLPAEVVVREAAPSVSGDWLTPEQLEAWLGCSARTIRRRRHDGTWRQGVHWFQRSGARVRFSRQALDTWLRETGATPPETPLGLAYGPDIPEGRRHRRLTLLRNECTSTPDGATAEADGATPGVSGARAAHRAP